MRGILTGRCPAKQWAGLAKRFALFVLLFFAAVESNAFPLDEQGKDKNIPADYWDPGSGILLAGQVYSFKRTNLVNDWPVKGATSAAYETVDYTEALAHTLNRYAMNTEIKIVPYPATLAQPVVDTIIGAIKRKYPRFKSEPYDGETVFGASTAVCGQGSLDIPARSNRAICQVMVIPKGRYLVAFRFIFAAARQKNFQPEIDQFVVKILGEKGR